jgi:hypothetical protein
MSPTAPPHPVRTTAACPLCTLSSSHRCIQIQVSLSAAPNDAVRQHLESLLVHNMRWPGFAPRRAAGSSQGSPVTRQTGPL